MRIVIRRVKLILCMMRIIVPSYGVEGHDVDGASLAECEEVAGLKPDPVLEVSYRLEPAVDKTITDRVGWSGPLPSENRKGRILGG